MRTSVDICIIDLTDNVTKVIIYKNGDKLSTSIFNDYTTAIKFASNIALALKTGDTNEK